MFKAAIVALVVVVTSLAFPRWEAYRDEAFYEKLGPPESLEFRTKKGHPLPFAKNIHVTHNDTVMSKTLDDRQELGNPATTIFCETSHAERCPLDNGRLLLIPGTATTTAVFYTRAPGFEPHHGTPVDLFVRGGYCVTACDIRGHGRSGGHGNIVTIPLLAADMVAAMESMHPGEKYHVLGYSIGGGTAFTIAIRFSQQILSAASVGFGLDQGKGAGMLQTVFSKRIVNRVFGLELIMTIAGITFQPLPGSVSLPAIAKHVSMPSFLEASTSWSNFNLLDEARTKLKIPVAYLRPEYDLATTHSFVMNEHAALGTELPHTFTTIKEFGHMIVGEPGGPEALCKHYHDFRKRIDA